MCSTRLQRVISAPVSELIEVARQARESKNFALCKIKLTDNGMLTERE